MSPHRSHDGEDLPLRCEPCVNGIFCILQRLFVTPLKRVIALAPAGPFKDFAGNVLERADAGIIQPRMPKPFAIRLTAGDSKTRVPPQLAFI